jgi:hypothetical protein
VIFNWVIQTDHICHSPVATVLSEDSPKIILKSGLFEHLPAPSHKFFEEEKPSWMEVV